MILCRKIEKKGGERIEATKQHLSVETSHNPLAVSSTFKLLTSAAVLHTLGLPLSLIIVYISLSLSVPSHSLSCSEFHFLLSERDAWLCFILQAVYP